MRTGAGGLRQVAKGAVVNRSSPTLQLEELDPVVPLPARCDRVRAVMAAFTVNCAVPLRVAVKRLILSISAAVAGAVVAARLIQPGVRFLSDLVHRAVAVDAGHLRF